MCIYKYIYKTKELTIYNDKNNNKFKNNFVKAFRNLQYYIDIHKIS